MAGNRTRIDCLEGNHDNHYTTIACTNVKHCFIVTNPLKKKLTAEYICVVGVRYAKQRLMFHSGIKKQFDNKNYCHLTALYYTSSDSRRVHETIPCDLHISYGERSGEKYDIFGAENLPLNSPIFIYIHGGYWQALDRSISAYCVPPLYNAGCVVVIVGYDLAPTGKNYFC